MSIATASLEIQVQTKDVQRAVTHLRAMERQGGDTEKSARALERRMAQLARQYNVFNRDLNSHISIHGRASNEVLRYKNALNSAYSAITRSQGALMRYQGAARQAAAATHSATSSISGMNGALHTFRGLVAGIGIARLGRAVVQTGTEFDRVRNILIAVFGTAAKADQQFNKLIQTSLYLGRDFFSLADTFAQMSAAAKGTNLEGEKMEKIFMAVAKTATVLRLNTEGTRGIIKAFEQMISKGTVQAEELRNQLGDRLPGAFNLFVRAVFGADVATEEMRKKFNKMMKDGQLVSAVVLPKVAKELEKTFGPGLAASITSAQAEIARMTTRLQLLGRSGWQAGFEQATKDIAGAFAEFFADENVVAFVENFARGFAMLTGILREFKGVLIGVTGALITFVTVFTGSAIVKVIGRLGMGMGSLATRIAVIASALVGLGLGFLSSGKQAEATNKSFEKTAVVIEKNSRLMAATSGVMSDAVHPYQSWKDALERGNQTVQIGESKLSSYLSRQRQATQSTKDLTRETKSFLSLELVTYVTAGAAGFIALGKGITKAWQAMAGFAAAQTAGVASGVLGFLSRGVSSARGGLSGFASATAAAFEVLNFRVRQFGHAQLAATRDTRTFAGVLNIITAGASSTVFAKMAKDSLAASRATRILGTAVAGVGVAMSGLGSIMARIFSGPLGLLGLVGGFIGLLLYARSSWERQFTYTETQIALMKRLRDEEELSKKTNNEATKSRVRNLQELTSKAVENINKEIKLYEELRQKSIEITNATREKAPNTLSAKVLSALDHPITGFRVKNPGMRNDPFINTLRSAAMKGDIKELANALDLLPDRYNSLRLALQPVIKAMFEYNAAMDQETKNQNLISKHIDTLTKRRENLKAETEKQVKIQLTLTQLSDDEAENVKKVEKELQNKIRKLGETGNEYKDLNNILDSYIIKLLDTSDANRKINEQEVKRIQNMKVMLELLEAVKRTQTAVRGADRVADTVQQAFDPKGYERERFIKERREAISAYTQNPQAYEDRLRDRGILKPGEKFDSQKFFFETYEKAYEKLRRSGYSARDSKNPKDLEGKATSLAGIYKELISLERQLDSAMDTRGVTAKDKIMNQYETTLQKLADAEERLKKAGGKGTTLYDKALEKLTEGRNAAAAIRDQQMNRLLETTDTIDKYIKRIKDEGEAHLMNGKSLREYNISLAQHNAVKRAASVAEEEYRAGLRTTATLLPAEIAKINAATRKAFNNEEIGNRQKEIAESVKSVWTGLADELSSKFTDLFSFDQERKSVRDFLLDVLKMIQRVILEIIRLQVIKPLIMGLFRSVGFIGSAKGNVFSGGNVVPFAQGGIIDRLTTFPMRNGKVGMAGEAGPEAIMPLERKGGVLGVKMFGGMGGGPIITNNFSVQVNVEGGSGGRGAANDDRAQAERIGKAVREELVGMVNEQISKQLRPGNMLNPMGNAA